MIGKKENAPKNDSINKKKTLIYLDRNNTPDIWADIKRTVDESSEKFSSIKDHQTVVLLPK